MFHIRYDDLAVFQVLTDVVKFALSRVVVEAILSHLEWNWQLYDRGRSVGLTAITVCRSHNIQVSQCESMGCFFPGMAKLPKHFVSECEHRLGKVRIDSYGSIWLSSCQGEGSA
jgi:hypothetical protein